MPSTLQVDTIKDGSATNTLVEQSGSDWVWGSAPPAGTVVQTKSDTHMPSGVVTVATSASTIYGSDLQVTITPTSTSNKLLLKCFIPDVYNNATLGRAICAGFRYKVGAFSSNTDGSTLGEFEWIADHQGYNHEAGAWISNLYYMTPATAPSTSEINIRPWLISIGGGVDTGICTTFGNRPTYGCGSLVVQEIKV